MFFLVQKFQNFEKVRQVRYFNFFLRLEVGQILTKMKASGRSDTSDYRTKSCGSHKVHKSPRNAILWKPLSSFVTK